jgi:hypothetical protein
LFATKDIICIFVVLKQTKLKIMKFKLTANVTISVYTEVEADTLKEAIKIAKERELVSITKTGCDTEQDTWMCDELDGIPTDIFEE